MKALVLTLALLLPFVLALTPQEDDIVFDDIGEEMTSVSPVAHHEEYEEPAKIRTEKKKSKHRVERLWDIPDASVIVGHVFKLRIPKDAFGGNVDHFEVHEKNKKKLAHWIYWDEAASTFLGVPSKKEIGDHHVTVIAHGKHGDVAKDSFVVYVEPEKYDKFKHKDSKKRCKDGEEQTLLTISLDAKFEDLTPLTKVEAIQNLAGFLGLHASSLSMHYQNEREGSQDMGVKSRKEKHWAFIQWQIGCEGDVWSHQERILKQLTEQIRDRTLTEVVQIPVLRWSIQTDESRLLRGRREIGSGDYGDNEEYDEYDDEDFEESYDTEPGDDDENDPITELPPRSFVPNVSASKVTDNGQEHRHRHGHGEGTIDWKPVEEIDEDEIVPQVNQRLGNGFNGSSTIPVSRPTPSPQTSTTIPSTTSTLPTTTTTIASTTPPTTTLSTSTTESFEPSFAASATPERTSSEISISTSTTQSISAVVTSESPITSSGTSTMSISAGPSSSTDSLTNATSETPKTNVIEDPVEQTNFVGFDYEFGMSTVSPTENITTSSSVSPFLTTSPQTPFAGASTVVVTSSEKMEANYTSGLYSNVTDEEPTITTEMSPSINASTGSPSPAVVSTTTMMTEVPVVITTTTTTTTTTIPTPEPTPLTTTTTTTPPPPPPTTTTTTTTTTTPMPTTTTKKPTEPTTTEKIEYGARNFPPRQDKRLKKIPVTAGKPLSYIIPADTFSDIEDGDTRKLRLSLYLQDNPVKSTHWLQLNPQTQEVYGLPLESDVSKWDHDLVASDSEGLNVTERLDIYVQQHKLSRSVNHEFSVYLKIEKRTAFPTNVDWELKVVRSLAQLYGDNDPSQITVRAIDITQDQAIFTWTNDSVPRSSECPKDEINRLLHVLIADKDGEPSALLVESLGPEIRVKRVVYQGIGQCEEMKRPELPKVPTQEPTTNFAPMPRNQVDHINATVGKLLVYKVPDDTFYDPEDGSAYNMQMSLLTNDRSQIPPHNWLQFDAKNREFYGIPLREDIGRKEYQLVVTDKAGASATDGMVVIVQPAPFKRHSVEFSMTLAIPYESFAHSALQKKTFIEKIAKLFGDSDTSAISLESISEGSTIVTWRNTTLPTDPCPDDEIARLSNILVKDDKSLTDKIEECMGQEFPVKQITLTPMGMCVGQLTGVYSPDGVVPPSEDSTSVGASHDDYLITFVLPAIIIAAMLVLAGIIACILYRRRRSGKMSVSEQDDERQSFRSKGIPVIFQDELDEKPDPGNKSPVILKEEKPPLPPPEYQKAEDGADVPMLSQENSEEPYQPPPPFATSRDNNRQNRPKPTPTYRKPPPYVPP